MEEVSDRLTGARPPRLQPKAIRPAEAVEHHGAVDFLPGERERAEKPLRPPGHRRKPRFVGSLRLQLELGRLPELKPPVKVTLVAASPAMPRGRRQLEAVQVCSDLHQPVVFEALEAGAYVVIFQPCGYRPTVHQLQFSRRTQDFSLAFPLLPVENELQERELLRPGERHPFILHARAFLRHFGYLGQEICHCPADQLCEHLSTAMHLYQKVFHLEGTASLTVEMLLDMFQPRCPLPDFPESTY